jgi:hypothetical protein
MDARGNKPVTYVTRIQNYEGVLKNILKKKTSPDQKSGDDKKALKLG